MLAHYSLCARIYIYIYIFFFFFGSPQSVEGAGTLRYMSHVEHFSVTQGFFKKNSNEFAMKKKVADEDEDEANKGIIHVL